MGERIIISDAGVYIPYELIDIVRRAKKDLTQMVLTGPPGNKYHVPVEFFTKTPLGLCVPMAYVTTHPQWLRDDSRSTPAPFNHPFRGQLRDTQRKICRKVTLTLTSRNAATMILPTGGGKTVAALYIMTVLKVKPIIMVHKTFLADQWRARIEQYLGPSVKISTIQGNVYDTSGDIIIAMIQTFVKRGYSTPPEAGLLIIDECHHIAASMFKRIMWKASQQYILGLSATPKRADNLDIHKLLGDPIVLEDEPPMIVADGIVTPPPKPPPGHPKYTPDKVTVLTYPYQAARYLTQGPLLMRTGDINYTKMVSTLIDDQYRTGKIVDLLQTHDMVRGKDTLILSHRRAHCEYLHTECVKRRMDAALFLAPKSRKKGADYSPPNSSIIISTYAYVSEGFDVPRLECLILATPATNIEQACGRVMRRMEDPSHRPVIVDIVDRWSLFNAQATKRRAFYTKQRFTRMNILPDQADGGDQGTQKKARGMLFIDE